MKEKVTIEITEEQFTELTQSRKIVRLKIKDQRICLTFDGEKWVAFEEACPHLGVSLAGGHVTPFNEIVCAWHGYRFNLFDGREAGQRCKDLKLFEVVLEQGKLTVLI